MANGEFKPNYYSMEEYGTNYSMSSLMAVGRYADQSSTMHQRRVNAPRSSTSSNTAGTTCTAGGSRFRQITSLSNG